MKATIVGTSYKSCAEILEETKVNVEMSALDLLLITTAIGKLSLDERKRHLEAVSSNITSGLHGEHPMAMLTRTQRDSILNNYAKLEWAVLRVVTKDVLRQLGMEEN